ncbi:MAG: serine hydrolase domain-containing protein [Acidimicrobiales bacterium]
MLKDNAVEILLARAAEEIDSGLLPSCQVALALDGEVVLDRTLGEPVHGDESQYLIYSATKGVVSAAFLQLLGEGRLSLDTRVADIIDEFASFGKEAVTVGQVMTYTSAFARAPMGPPAWWTKEGRLEQFARWRLDGEIGKYDYHITSGHWVLAALLEEVEGVDFSKSVNRRIGEALSLQSLRLGVPEDSQTQLVRPVLCGEPATEAEFQAALGISGIDAGEANDDNLVALGEAENIALGLPGGGAVSRAADLAMLYQALMRNTESLWDPEVLADATSNVRIFDMDLIRGVPANRSIAFMIAGADGASAGRGLGHGAHPTAFGHDGIGGQLAFADPSTGLSFSYLTDGMDRNILRQQRRARSLATKANGCA